MPGDDDTMSNILERTNGTSANIVESLGAVVIGNTFSLFMPLATYNLRTYLQTEAQPNTIEMKMDIIIRAIGLVSITCTAASGLARVISSSAITWT